MHACPLACLSWCLRVCQPGCAWVCLIVDAPRGRRHSFSRCHLWCEPRARPPPTRVCTLQANLAAVAAAPLLDLPADQSFSFEEFGEHQVGAGLCWAVLGWSWLGWAGLRWAGLCRAGLGEVVAVAVPLREPRLGQAPQRQVHATCPCPF